MKILSSERFKKNRNQLALTDVHNKKTRSHNMSKIRSKDTIPELLVRKFLHSKGFRYRLHDKKLPGKPDIVLPKYSTVIMVNGCYWHGHEKCKFFVIPETRREWWTKKIFNTKEKDLQNQQKLQELGWNIIVVWADCELQPKRRNSKIREEKFDELIRKLKIANTDN